MADDVSKLKIGQAPAGITVKTPPVSPPSGPLPPPPPRPLSASQPIAVPPPSLGGHLGRIIALAVLAVGLGAAIYWFVSSRQPAEVVPSATPSPTATATPTPVPTVSDLFSGTAENVEYLPSPTAASDFYANLNKVVLDGGQIKKLNITNGGKGAQEIGPLDLADVLLAVSGPVKSSLGSDGISLLYGQREAFDSKGKVIPGASVQKRLVLVFEATEPSALATALKDWELPATSNTWGRLLNFDGAKSATPDFQEITSRGITVRYKNFPYPDRSLDYAILTAPNGKSYLVVGSSRESFLAVLNALLPPLQTPPIGAPQ